MRTPDQIERWLATNEYRMDSPVQYLGDEPNALRRDWASASLRWLIAASWPYEHAAGNQSIPAVCQSITDSRSTYLADRFYLPATARDMRLLETGGIPVFGIESKHEMRDFDVVGTSISYLVLLMNFAKMLTMSGLPLRWREREERMGEYPMVVIGGQAYSAPAAMEPIADCLWLGEVETEPGNGGMAHVCRTIEEMKLDGIWASDRLSCYRQLAQQYEYLHFPRFVRTEYTYADRGLPEQSKVVAGFENLLPGQVFPRRSRKVHNMDKIPYLRSAPLLYADPDMGAGDMEVARGCVGEDEYVFLPGRGIQRLGDFASDVMHPISLDVSVRGSQSGAVSHVLDNGVKPVVSVRTKLGDEFRCTPDHRVWTDRGWLEAQFLEPGVTLPSYYGQRAFGPEQALSTEYARVQSSNYRHAGFVGNRANSVSFPEKLTPELAWLLGHLTGDGGIERDCKSVFFMTVLSEPEVEERVRSLMFELFGLRPTTKLRDGVPVKYLYFYSQPLVRWLAGNFGYAGGKATEHTKLFVPRSVLSSPAEIQQQYLLGLFEADAHVAKMRLATISPLLAKQVVVMLRNLGLPASRSSKVRTSEKGYGGVDWEVRVWKAADSDRSWLRFVAPVKDEAAAKFRSSEVTQGAKFHKRTTGLVTDEVVSVTSAGSQRVLDLHVPEHDCFDVAGILVHNCPAWCSFCRLSWVTKPYRQRDVALSVRHAAEWNDNMGSVELSPFSPDFPMHTQRKLLIKELLEKVNDEADSVAMRVDDFIADGDYILLQALGGMDAVTLGLEGNSQRMRDLVGKGTSDADVVEAVTKAIRAGIRKVKLFMITNLPGEEPADVMRIVQLAARLAAVRDELSQPNVRIQFSWTPLLIEAGTPFQWFAPTHADHTLISVAEQFRDLKIDFKIGTKAEVNKVAFFQLCQRASADAGEAIVDVLAALDTGCWGGVPRDMRDRLEQSLRAHGFKNGFDDLFDERYYSDLFGWEYIDTGVAKQLMWDTYQQMVEFLVNTDSETYDAKLGDGYHGNEWVARCDTHCSGKSCGACSPADLKLRTGYIRAAQHEADIDLTAVRPLDQSSIRQKVRVEMVTPQRLRFVGNAHWRYSIRRAAYQEAAGHGFSIAKRSIIFATDGFETMGTHGIDYAEFGITRDLDGEAQYDFLQGMSERLEPWMQFVRDGTNGSYWELPVSSNIRKESAVAYYEIPVIDDLDSVARHLRDWETAEHIKLTLRQDTAYFGLSTQDVNAKDYADDLWLTRQGTLRMLARGMAGPHQLYAALMGTPSWIEVTSQPATRLAIFTADSTGRAAMQGDLLGRSCDGCGLVIPRTMLGNIDPDGCPRCVDEAEGLVIAGLDRRLAV